MGVGVHAVAGTRGDVLDETEAEGSSAVLVALEFGNGRLGRVGCVESYHTGASRPTAGLILDLSLLNLADSREELNKIVIASGPRQL